MSGFGNITAIHSGTKHFGFLYNLDKEGIYDEWDAKTGSSFGLQLNAKITNNWDGVVQAVLQDRINNDVDRTITRAFVRYQATPELTVRAGRFASPLYMLSEYRDVGFAYLWTKPITDFYSNIPVTTVDGIEAIYSSPVGEGVWEGRVYAGKSSVSISTVYDNYDVELSPLLGMKLSYFWHRWTLTGLLSTAKVHKGEPAEGLLDLVNQNPSLSCLADAPIKYC